MDRYFRFFRRKSIVCVAVAWALIAIVPASQAESAANINKRAQKIEKQLAKYSPGAFLEIDLRDNTEALGSLGELSDATFLFTSSDSNRKMTISYADVAQVKKGKEYIGAGSGPFTLLARRASSATCHVSRLILGMKVLRVLVSMVGR